MLDPDWKSILSSWCSCAPRPPRAPSHWWGQSSTEALLKGHWGCHRLLLFLAPAVTAPGSRTNLLRPAEQCQHDALAGQVMAHSDSGTQKHRFISYHCGREGSARCPKQPGMLLTGCRSPVSGMAAMDSLQHKGRRTGAVAFAQGSAKGSLHL